MPTTCNNMTTVVRYTITVIFLVRLQHHVQLWAQSAMWFHPPTRSQAASVALWQKRSDRRWYSLATWNGRTEVR